MIIKIFLVFLLMGLIINGINKKEVINWDSSYTEQTPEINWTNRIMYDENGKVPEPLKFEGSGEVNIR